MKYPYIVVKNGRWYDAGEDVDENEGAEKSASEFYDQITASEEKKYTKTEISRMKTDDLREIAISVGIENANEMTGVDLKQQLTQHFGL